MKRILLYCLSLLNFLTAQAVQTYYVSSSLGSDENNGLSEKSPFQTISKAPKSNAVIKLKAGDVFYESIFDLKNCTVSAYGTGDKPVVCGFKTVKPAQKYEAWTSYGNDVWRIDLTKLEDFSGFFKAVHIVNNIGVLYCKNEDLVYGHMVKSKDLLKDEGDFFVSDERLSKNVNSETYRYLYLKHHENPGVHGEWSFSCRAFGIYNLNGCHISDIKVQGFSGNGIWGITNTKVERCELDLIGGAIQLDTYEWVRFGNGVEFYMDRELKNCEIRNCHFSRIYDCGATIQLNKSAKVKFQPVSIKFIDNVFVNCRQGFEHFLPPELSYQDCAFSNNIIFNAGDNGFNSPEKRDAAFLSYESIDRNDLLISDNTIFGSPFYCGKHFTKNMKGNVVYIYDDQYLTSYHFDASFPVISAKDKESVAQYQKVTNDGNTEFVVMERNSFMSSIYRYWYARKVKNSGKVGD